MLTTTLLNIHRAQFKILSEENDIDTILSLRFDVFCKELGVFNDHDCSPQRESDEYDQRSLHTVLTYEGEIIAYTRLILPCDEFPIEKSCSLPRLFNRDRTVEISRTLVRKEHRDGSALWLLLENVYRLCQKRGVESILSLSNTIVFNGVRKRNIPFRQIGDPILFHGHKSYPIIITVDKDLAPNFIDRY